MMFAYVMAVTLSLVFWVIYKYYLKPKRLIKHYKQLLKQLNYTYYEQPFIFLGVSFMQMEKQYLQKYNDCLYYQKTIYPQVDIVIGNIMDKIVINLVNPELIKEFLSLQMILKYVKNEAFSKGFKLVLKEGIVFSEGLVWKKKRKMLAQIFTFDMVKENIGNICRTCDEAFELFDKKFKCEDQTVRYNIKLLGGKIFNKIIMTCFFGVDQINEPVEGKDFQQFVLEMAQDINQTSFSAPVILLGKLAYKLGLSKRIRNLSKGMPILKQKMFSIINKRIETISQQKKPQKYRNILQTLIYEHMNKGEEFSYEIGQIVDEFFTFFLAGTDTTQNFFSMMIYYISKNPAVQKRLRQEITEFIKTDADFTYQNLQKLKYIDSVQNQTLRVYPPLNAIFYRDAKEDNLIKDLPILKETQVTIKMLGNHYKSQYFEDPFTFNPERWQKQQSHVHPYAFLPFSGGPRSCIGKQLSNLNSKIALVKLLKRYKSISIEEQIKLRYGLIYESKPFVTIFTPQ